MCGQWYAVKHIIFTCLGLICSHLQAGDLQLEEKLSEDEIAWLQLDKILSPHIYEPAERATLVTNKRQRSTNVLNPEVRDPTDLVSSIVPLNSTLGNGLQISGEKGFREVAPPTLMNDGKENDRAGDKFEEIRWRFENGEVIFEAPWTCVANRDELLEIRSSIDEIGLSDHDIRCKRLMEKYYVDDDESLLGQNRMKHVQAISSGIARHVVKEEQLASENRAELLNRSVSMVAEQALNDELAANRKWGSFEVVHPASAGISSQQAYFMRAGFDVSRDHPAAFAIHPEDQNPFAEDDDSLDAIFVEKKKKREDPTGLEARQLGKKTLLTLPGDDKVETVFKNDPNSMWFICESPAELAKQEYRRTRGKVILLAEPNPLVLLDICDLALQARQSRSHRFDIPDQDDSRILEICVSIMFQGTFSEKGYRFGRIAVGLFRLQDEKGEGGITNPPRPVGFAPYDLQSPNTPESMGRIVIVHRPQLRPIQPGTFQIVIGCAAYSKYSVHVACVYAKSALPVVDKLITQAKINQARLPMCLKEIDDLIAGTRLAERKLLICNQMIRETETEAHRCEVAMESVHDLLVKDDELMTMTEDERKIHNKELAILEVEFAQSNATYTSRCIELDYIKEGIKLMHEFQRERQLEKKNLKEALEVARRDLPACMALLRSMSEATNIAILLNTTLDGKLSNSGISGAGAPPEQQRVSTPADHVRRLYRSEGYNILSLEEKQFLVLDQAMVPHKYEWETEQLEEENLRRQEQGKRPKKPRKYNPAVEAFRYHLIEHDVMFSVYLI